MLDAFRKADEVLLNAVQGISDLITVPGLINVDFADVRTIMSDMGRALMGTGRARGRAPRHRGGAEGDQLAAARGRLHRRRHRHPHQHHRRPRPHAARGQRGVDARSRRPAHEDANIIFGSVIDANLVDEVRITVIATGFDRAVAHMDDPMAHAPVERKRATQIAMPYTGIPTAARPHVPPTQSPRQDQVELKAQQAMRGSSRVPIRRR